MFQLSEIEKLLVLAICFSLLALTIVVTVCVVSPSCLIYECLRKLAKRRKMKYGSGLEEGAFIKLAGTPQYTVDCGPASKILTSQFRDDFGSKHTRKREDSTYSSMSSGSQGNASVSNYSEASLETPTGDPNDDQDMSYGQVTFSMWCGANDNGNIAQLTVSLKEAQYLPPRLYGGTCDPYLLLSMYKDKGRKRWSKNQKKILYEFRTTTQRKTQHPLFKESFVMDVSRADLKDNVIKIRVLDDEKYANDSELGQVILPLRDIPIQWKNGGEEHEVTVDFNEPKQDRGELLFGISYLPTAERLTFNIVKANNLSVVTNDIESFVPFIRVLLLHNGKMLKKKKTSSRPGTANPVFSQTLTFDVPPAQLDHIIFLLVASHRDVPDEIISSPDTPTTPPTSTSRKGRHIGKVVIGSSIRGLGFNHWNAMKQSPRKQVTQWHNLR